MTLAVLALWFPSRALAQDAGALRVTVTVDDRALGRLHGPAVRAGGGPVALRDDGSVAGDTAGDGVWAAVLDVPRSERVTLQIVEGNAVVGEAQAVLPSTGEARVSLRVDATGIAVADGTVEGRPREVDAMQVHLQVDDRAAQRLRRPVAFAEQAGGEPVPLSDDGSVETDLPGDRVWIGELAVRRAEYLALAIREGDDEVGVVTVFLPASGEAVVRVQTTEDGVELVNEPIATGTAQPVVPAGGGTGRDRLAHVLWVAIALFAVGFGYARTVVWRTWREEIAPRLGPRD